MQKVTLERIQEFQAHTDGRISIAFLDPEGEEWVLEMQAPEMVVLGFALADATAKSPIPKQELEKLTQKKYPHMYSALDDPS